MLASKWGAKAFGQQFVVENRPGAGSTIAADLTAKSAPDGYTVLISDSKRRYHGAHLFNSLPYDPFRESSSRIASRWWCRCGWWSTPSVAANSIQELVALAKSGKEPMPYASSGNGSIHHITMELFKADTRINFTHVPFKGAGQSVPAMIAETSSSASSAIPRLRARSRPGACVCSRSAWRGASALTPEVPRLPRPWIRGSTWRRRSACSSPPARRARSSRGSTAR